jgi:hypothetical protein
VFYVLVVMYRNISSNAYFLLLVANKLDHVPFKPLSAANVYQL